MHGGEEVEDGEAHGLGRLGRGLREGAAIILGEPIPASLEAEMVFDDVDGRGHHHDQERQSGLFCDGLDFSEDDSHQEALSSCRV